MNVDVQNLWSGDRFWSRKLSINPWPFQQALAAHVWRAKEELHLPKCILKPISKLVWWRLRFLKMTWRLQEFAFESSVSLCVMVCQVELRNDCSVSLFSAGADSAIYKKSNMYQNPMEGRFCVCKSPILSVSWTESPNAAKQQALSYNFAGPS